MISNYLFHSTPLAMCLRSCRPHDSSLVGGTGTVGGSSVRRSHRGDQRLDHPLQIRAGRDGCDSGDERGTWCCQVSEILWAIRETEPQQCTFRQKSCCSVARMVMNEDRRASIKSNRIQKYPCDVSYDVTHSLRSFQMNELIASGNVCC